MQLPVTLKPVHLFSKRLLLSTCLFTYTILFTVLFFTCGIHNMTTGEKNGCYLIIAILAAFSGAWLGYDMWFMRNRVEHFQRLNLMQIMLFVPLAGCILNYIIIKQEKAAFKYNQLQKDPNWKQHKEQMAVQVLLIVVTVITVLTIWLVYAIQGHTKDANGNIYIIPGILDIALAPIKGFIDGAEIIIYLLIMGAFLQAVNSSKSLDAGIGRLVRKLKGKELVIVPVIMILFSVGGATFGMWEETIAFYAVIMPIVLAAGFDAITGVIIIIFGAGLGVCSSVINPFMIMTSVDAVNTAIPGINMTLSDGIVFRIIIYIVLLSIGIVFTTLYARKVKLNPQKSIVYEFNELHKSTFTFNDTQIPELTTKRKITLWIFTLTFVVMIIGAIPWNDLTGWDGLERFNQILIDDFPFLATGVGAVGAWYLASFSLLFLVSAFLITLLNWQGANHFYQECMVGAKDFLSLTFVIAIARGLSQILTKSGLNVSISNGIGSVLGINQILGTIVLFLIFIVISIFIPSTSGFAYTVFGPIAAPALYHAHYSIAAGIASTSLANGLVNLVSPTGGIFVIGCEMAKVPLKSFYKSTWKLLLIVFAATIILLIVGVYLPKSIMGK